MLRLFKFEENGLNETAMEIYVNICANFSRYDCVDFAVITG